ncbi:MAG: helix-turn-helix domain-containing protein [Sulfurimicrobium sp.]|nr:helix-turn-helix domain-containing protein [Sulfurimicrobium sp.]MDP1703384.1 helix-turn-helix domain-containing protein [Sulfurimicrobium sp.]MDP2200159.1 helix-turn-helix domain-containing protein [Sulfurimicrobium sp.]MDP3689076.1 helix-turn-helix domain-containing protein [Sulfurimicrobium sp.]
MLAVSTPLKRVKIGKASSQPCAPIACTECGIYNLCFAVGGDTDLSFLNTLVKSRRTYKRGEPIFSVGEPFRAVFAIRSGSVKTSVLTDDGRVQVTGFHISGELMGLNSLVANRYNSEARALETTSVCEVPFERYEELVEQVPGLQQQMIRIMSQEINHHQEMMLLLGKKRAEERLASFLVNLSLRLKHHSQPAEELKLSMSRSDIGNYLGLAEETVCRVITRFEEESLIATQRRNVRLIQPDRLLEISRGGPAIAK